MPKNPYIKSLSEDIVKSVKSPEEIRKSIREQELFHLNLGYIAGLFSNSKYHANFTIDYLMASVIPALRYNQFKIFFSGFRPVAYVSWARLSDEIENKFRKGDYFLKMDDWQSGDNTWLVEFVVPYSNFDREQVIKNLKEKIFLTEEVKSIVRNKDGSIKRIFVRSKKS